MEPESSERRIDHDDGPAVDPVTTAFDSVFESVATLYRATGSVFHQLIGLRLKGGRGVQSQIEFVKAPEMVGRLVARMAAKCDAVAHVRLAPRLPGSVSGIAGQVRPPVLIEIHRGDVVAFAYCAADPQTRLLTRGELMRREPGASPSAA